MLSIDTNCLNELGSNPEAISEPVVNLSYPIENKVVKELEFIFGTPDIEWMGEQVSQRDS